MSAVAPSIVNDVSYVAVIMRVILHGRRGVWRGWRVSQVAPRIVNGVSYVTGRRVSLVDPLIVNDMSCVTPINDESHFVWQTQYLVMLDGS